MPPSTLSAEHVLLEGISWETYAQLRAELGRRPIRLSYDTGSLEIMTRSLSHELRKRRLGRLVEALTEELGLPLQSGGSTTWQRADLGKALEPDECYWIEHAEVVRGRDELDLRFDPLPDLAIEVGVDFASLDRMEIYAALGVPEVWRWKNETLSLHRLGDRRQYAELASSRAIPGLLIAELAPWMIRAREVDETEWIQEFRAWARARR